MQFSYGKLENFSATQSGCLVLPARLCISCTVTRVCHSSSVQNSVHLLCHSLSELTGAMKRAWPFQPRAGTLARTHAGFTRRVRGRTTFQKAAGRGRFAGYYRKTGYYGRYNNPKGGNELKFHDIDVDQAVADLSAGVIVNAGSINLIGQNITESTRIGRKCVVRSIGWRGSLLLASLQGTTVQATYELRTIMYLDKQANGVTAAVGDILQSANYHSFNNLANKSRFVTLMDKNYTVAPQVAAGNGTADDTGAHSRPFSFFKKVNIPLEFSGTADPSVMTELRSNNIGILFISLTGSSILSIDSKVRLRFSDE